MTLDELRAALAAAAHDDARLRDVVKDCVRAMRNGQVRDLIGFAVEIAPLRTHASEGVRLEIAKGCEVFPDPVFDRVFDHAVADPDPHVRANAKSAGQKRAVRKKGTARTAEKAHTETTLYASLERAHGKHARRTAERAARAGVEHFVERLYHEFRRISSPVEQSLEALRAELRAPVPSHTVLTDGVEVLRERHRYLGAVLKRAREYATGVKPTFEEGALGDVVRTACDALVARLGPQSARLALTVDVDPTLTLELDRDALLEALDNVLQNAVEAFDPGVPMAITVAARTRRHGTQVELSIRDGGRGMGDVDREGLFVPFGSRKPGGMGFGMLMVRKMVEAVHGGDLEIESAPGEGTTVTFRLPAKQVPR